MHLAIRKAGVVAFPTATAFIPRHPAIMNFLARDAGYCALLLLAQAVLSNALPGSGDLSYTAIAGRLGVSRTHVRSLFVEAAAADYLSLADRGGHVVEIRPQLWEAFDRFLADMESAHDAIAQMALANI